MLAKSFSRRGQAPIPIHNIKTCFKALLKVNNKYYNSRILFMAKPIQHHLPKLNKILSKDQRKKMKFPLQRIATKLRLKLLLNHR